MKEEKITLETAKLASERGYSPILLGNSFRDKLPTQSLLQKWLREVHNITIIVAPIHETEDTKSLVKYWYYILDVEDDSDDEVFYGNWEDALEMGLQEGLKLIEIAQKL